MKKHLFFYLLVFVLSFFSCRFVTPSTHVSGSLFNAVTQEPIAGEPIIIMERGYYFGPDRGIIKTEVTDENGEFEFKFKTSVLPEYDCEIMHSDRFIQIGGDDLSNVDMRKVHKNEMNFIVAPKAFLRLPINNTHYVNAQDEMGYRCYHVELKKQQFGRPNDGYDTRFGDYHAEGAYYDQAIEVPMGTYAFDWYVIRNGIKTTFVDTLYLAAEQDTLYEINY